MTWHLFEGYGVELEYMIVEQTNGRVAPISDWLLHSFSGTYESEIEGDGLNWSNELVLHVIELKTQGPEPSLQPLAQAFQKNVGAINQRLQEKSARLMPTAMHPGMVPERETKLWPHEYNQVYEAYNRIFDCRGHGWSNLQSVHINLPFANDDEFGRLHAAIRLILPILPALAASSPLVEYQANGVLDNRMKYYAVNSAKVPSVTGKVVPEAVFSKADYEAQILQKIYRDIAPFDPEETLQDEWCNARGAIARFDRNAIEIRVLDIQECPLADIAIAWLIVSSLKALCNEIACSYQTQQSFHEDGLAAILQHCVTRGLNADIEDAAYLQVFGLNNQNSASVRELWQRLFDAAKQNAAPGDEPFFAPIEIILKQGNLSTRILNAVGDAPPPSSIDAVYAQLCDCLSEGRLFVG
ncbi:MAG: glutamate-cysteine ligase family protein [Candidatus Hinthialibacter antarcticus]|nr:glutamate-cysteine ligase family protein [Candidatus Hinthialibacter antarcticus]